VCLIKITKIFIDGLSEITYVFQLQEVGDFEAPNCLPALNLIPSINLYLPTE